MASRTSKAVSIKSKLVLVICIAGIKFSAVRLETPCEPLFDMQQRESLAQRARQRIVNTFDRVRRLTNHQRVLRWQLLLQRLQRQRQQQKRTVNLHNESECGNIGGHETRPQMDLDPILLSGNTPTKEVPSSSLDVGKQTEMNNTCQVSSQIRQDKDECAASFTLPSAILTELNAQVEQEPGKVAVATDSASGLPAMLLTARLVFVMNEIRARSRLTEVLEEQKINALKDVQSAWDNISLLDKELEDEMLSEERKAAVEREKKDAEAARATYRKRVSSLDENQGTELNNLRSARNEFLNTMERALTEAGFLEPLAENNDIYKSQKRLYGDPTQGSQASYPIPESAVSAGELEREAECQAAQNNLNQAHQYLFTTRQQFEERDIMYQHDLEDYRQALEAGTTAISMTEFDLAYFQNVSALTRCLLEAEEYYEAAVERARGLNVLPSEYEQESNFRSITSDGYRDSFAAALSARAPIARIEEWKEVVSIALGLESSGQDSEHLFIQQPDDTEMDQWTVTAVSLSESVGAKNQHPKWRKRIDHWRQACESLREQASQNVLASSVER